MWSTKWKSWDDMHWDEIDVPTFQMDRVLVAAGIVDSRSNAQRLVKQNAITWRPADDVTDWKKVTDFRQEIESGWPVYLRVGDGHPRTVMMEVEVEELPPMGAEDQTPVKKKVTKPRSFFSVACLMRPQWNEGLEEDGVTPWRVFQSRDTWDEVWRPEKMPIPLLAEFEWEHAFTTKAERDKWELPVNASVAESADALGREPSG